MYLLKPKSCVLLATPANSAVTSQKLQITRPSIRMAVVRRPNSSRISSLRPLPVVTPMRAEISCAKVSMIAMGIMVHSSP